MGLFGFVSRPLLIFIELLWLFIGAVELTLSVLSQANHISDQVQPEPLRCDHLFCVGSLWFPGPCVAPGASYSLFYCIILFIIILGSGPLQAYATSPLT